MCYHAAVDRSIDAFVFILESLLLARSPGDVPRHPPPTPSPPRRSSALARNPAVVAM
jgi:hypothetical protein